MLEVGRATGESDTSTIIMRDRAAWVRYVNRDRQGVEGVAQLIAVACERYQCRIHQ